MMKHREVDIILALKKRILSYLKSHNKMTLKEISLISGFSVKHTQELFFKQNGITIGKYIKQCQFSKAIILLVLTRKSILSISLDTGYSSQQSFSRAFKKEFSLSPMKYRERSIIDSQKLISEFQLGGKFIYDGILYLDFIKTKSTLIRFTDSVLSTANIITKNKRLQKIKLTLSKSDSVIIISSITPIKNETLKIHINSFFCSAVESGGEICTVKGLYYKIKFNGSLDDYINMGRNIIFYIKIPFSLDVIEKIKKDEDGVDITIFIPKKSLK